MGIPYICPYNVHSIMNPILVMCTGLGYFFNLYRNKPLVREGGVVIMTHPTLPDFNPVHHPSYIDFYEQVLADTTDPHEMSKTWEERYAYDDWYRHLYRTSYAYHGVHPFYMWYWGAHGMRHCGRVIIVGGDDKAVAPPRLHVGIDAERRPGDGQRCGRPLRHDHPPAHPAADDRRRAMSDDSRRARHRSSRWLRSASRLAGTAEQALGQGHGAAAQRRLPVSPADRAARRRGAGRAAVARRRLRHGVGPLAGRQGGPPPDRRRPPAPADRLRSPTPRSTATTASPTSSRGRRATPVRPPVIFAPNHHSHLDTALMVRAVPAAWRRHLVTAAAADYFFDKRWKATLAAFALNAIPVDREVTNRKSADLMAGLIDDGWSLVIYPEGGRSPDGWGQTSRSARPTSPGGPAHPSCRCTSTGPTRSWARAPASPSPVAPG